MFIFFSCLSILNDNSKGIRVQHRGASTQMGKEDCALEFLLNIWKAIELLGYLFCGFLKQLTLAAIGNVVCVLEYAIQTHTK